MLQQDVKPGLDWAEAVFGGPPDAANLWIGDDRSVTSFHKGEAGMTFYNSCKGPAEGCHQRGGNNHIRPRVTAGTF